MPSVGQALLALIKSEAGSPASQLKSYTAVGWHAQVRKLSEMGERGSKAADAAGLNPSPRQLRSWLSEQSTPRESDRAAIKRAYDSLAGRPVFPQHIKGRELKFTGNTPWGSDTKRPHVNDLRLGAKNDLKWDEIERAYEAGMLDDDMADLLAERDLIEHDLGNISPIGSGFGNDCTLVTA